MHVGEREATRREANPVLPVPVAGADRLHSSSVLLLTKSQAGSDHPYAQMSRARSGRDGGRGLDGCKSRLCGSVKAYRSQRGDRAAARTCTMAQNLLNARFEEWYDLHKSNVVEDSARERRFFPALGEICTLEVSS